jgi:hypothetical protein
MKNYLLILLFLGVSCHAFGQYNPYQEHSPKLEYKSRKEIRKFLLAAQPRDSMVYYWARKSDNNKVFSHIAYTLAGAALVTGIASLSQAAFDKNISNFDRELAHSAFFAGIGGATFYFSLGLLQSHRSRKQLDKAMRLYNQSSLY